MTESSLADNVVFVSCEDDSSLLSVELAEYKHEEDCKENIVKWDDKISMAYKEDVKHPFVKLIDIRYTDDWLKYGVETNLQHVNMKRNDENVLHGCKNMKLISRRNRVSLSKYAELAEYEHKGDWKENIVKWDDKITMAYNEDVKHPCVELIDIRYTDDWLKYGVETNLQFVNMKRNDENLLHGCKNVKLISWRNRVSRSKSARKSVEFSEPEHDNKKNIGKLVDKISMAHNEDVKHPCCVKLIDIRYTDDWLKYCVETNLLHVNMKTADDNVLRNCENIKLISEQNCVNRSKPARLLNNGRRNRLPKRLQCRKKFTNRKNLEKNKRICDKLSYECAHCGQTLNNKGLLRWHVLRHISHLLFKCERCKKGFIEQADLDKHAQTHVPKYQCTLCEWKFKKPYQLRQHMGVHANEKNFKCDHCCSAFKLKKSLIWHILQHHTGEIQKCKQCSKSFPNLDDLLNRHIQEEHEKKNGNTGQMEPQPLKPYQCAHCQLVFFKQNCMKKHQLTHFGPSYECEHCHKKFTRNSYLTVHKRIHTGEKPFKCDVCGKDFIRSDQFKIHMRSHSGDHVFMCEYCSKTFVRSNYLQAHLRTHTGVKLFQCKECDKSFSQKGTLNMHMRTHSVKTFVCQLCSRPFTHKFYLTVHMRTHTGEKPYACDTCGKVFTQKSSLNVHVRRHMNGNDFRSTFYAKTFVDESSDEKFTCDICARSFLHKKYLEMHISTHDKPFHYKKCEKSFSQMETLNMDKRTHTGKQSYACDMCEKTFTQKNSLKLHIRRHMNRNDLRCTLCAKTFVDESSFGDHVCTSNGQQFTCDMCARSFSHKNHLEIHMSMHAVKPFVCLVCSRSFEVKYYLTAHMRSHTGEKPYRCDACGKAFSQKSSLNTHARSHTNGKVLRCIFCEKTFVHENSLRDHVCTYEGERFTCNICTRSFLREHNLQSHMCVHADDRKLFQCGECWRWFANKHSLKTHIRKHMDNMTFTCYHCAEEFSAKNNLSKHLRVEHSPDVMELIKSADHSISLARKNNTSDYQHSVPRPVPNDDNIVQRPFDLFKTFEDAHKF